MYRSAQDLKTDTDVVAYLKRHGEKDMLRFLTAGSVDDGKSTLIGRLLYDSKTLYEDQLAAVRADSATHGTTGSDFDPALLTDGLQAEREQGITIDVAYRYFSTDKRNFIIADTPGHEQYTRNMATGASTCNLAIILIDARYGVLEQTRRHSFIASLLGIRHLVVCVNKMDLVDYAQDVFETIRRDYEAFAAKLDEPQLHFIPISALRGDNVVEPGATMPWFQGGTLLYYLETVPISTDRNLIDMRFPVQYVLRPDLNFRGYCGTVVSGIIRRGDEIAALPSGRRTRVASIETFDGTLEEAFAPMAVTVTLADELDISRGDMLVHPNNQPRISQDFEANLVWMHENALQPGQTYWLKTSASLTPAVVSAPRYRFDINTLHRVQADTLQVNEIGLVTVTTHRAVCCDPYARNQATGAFVLIDRDTHATVAAGMILQQRQPSARPRPEHPKSANIRRETGLVSRAQREALLGQKAVTVWFTGLSGSGKSTIAREVEKRLHDMGRACTMLDGDNVRHGLNCDLAFSTTDRAENIRRVAEVARLFNEAGLIVLTSFISPTRELRETVRRTVGADNFIEIFVDAPIDVCESRDPKGLYKKAHAGLLPEFTGIDAPYEPPATPDIRLQTAENDLDTCVAAVLHGIEDAIRLSEPPSYP